MIPVSLFEIVKIASKKFVLGTHITQTLVLMKHVDIDGQFY